MVYSSGIDIYGDFGISTWKYAGFCQKCTCEQRHFVIVCRRLAAWAANKQLGNMPQQKNWMINLNKKTGFSKREWSKLRIYQVPSLLFHMTLPFWQIGSGLSNHGRFSPDVALNTCSEKKNANPKLQKLQKFSRSCFNNWKKKNNGHMTLFPIFLPLFLFPMFFSKKKSLTAAAAADRTPRWGLRGRRSTGTSPWSPSSCRGSLHLDSTAMIFFSGQKCGREKKHPRFFHTHGGFLTGKKRRETPMEKKNMEKTHPTMVWCFCFRKSTRFRGKQTRMEGKNYGKPLFWG